MLVISRKEQERVMIGDSIVITVAYIKGGRVGLGIQAPRELPIHRDGWEPVEDEPSKESPK